MKSMVIVKYENGWGLTVNTQVKDRNGVVQDVKHKEVVAGGRDALFTKLNEIIPNEEQRRQAV